LGFGITGRSFNSAHPAFNLQFQVRRAGLVSAEAELEGVFQMLQPEAIRTSFVASIQKWAMRDGLGHGAFPTRPTGHLSA
jgi:hypothetical protein